MLNFQPNTDILYIMKGHTYIYIIFLKYNMYNVYELMKQKKCQGWQQNNSGLDSSE